MTPNQIVNFLKNEDESAPKTDSEDHQTLILNHQFLRAEKDTQN